MLIYHGKGALAPFFGGFNSGEDLPKPLEH